MSNWVHLLCFLTCVAVIGHVIASPNSLESDECDKFYLTIDTEPEVYVPKSTYIVGIESNSLYAFSSFKLTTEPVNSTLSNPPGWFSLLPEDHETQFSIDAINTIIEQNDSPKQRVHVLWIAPRGRDCLLFKATINYRTKTKNCVQKIERKLCGLHEGADDQSFNQVPRSTVDESEEDCCACDEAAYNLIFEGLWSDKTHPKDFPTTLQLTHFSDIIGCTHSKNLTMWREGVYATEGLRQIAEFGSGSIMESELLEKKNHLRSLIKIPGLWYPRMNSNASAKFRVDRRHNLLSMASMLGPSPDWFTGVSTLNLCTKDCNWVESKTVDLPLYDAGTDDGISYMSPNAPTVPSERVYRITSTYPEDPRAPFYDMHGSRVKPIARLHLRREKVISKSCFEESMNDPNEKEVVTDSRSECSTTNFTEWSPCSATCGKGMQARIRNYVDPNAAKEAGCNIQLMSKKLCMTTSPCPGEEDDMLLFSDEQCKTGNWSEWSECTATCGIGFMTRTRRFMKHSSFKKCKHVSVYEKKKCMEPPCKKTIVEKEMKNCTTTEWSDWSPCSATCGTGIRVRVRHLIVSDEMMQQCRNNVTLEERRDCVRTKDCVIDKARAKDVCIEPSEKGPCRGDYIRWYYDSQAKKCVEFNYGGCRGNKNNFLTQNDCIRLCSGV